MSRYRDSKNNTISETPKTYLFSAFVIKPFLLEFLKKKEKTPTKSKANKEKYYVVKVTFQKLWQQTF